MKEGKRKGEGGRKGRERERSKNGEEGGEWSKRERKGAEG